MILLLKRNIYVDIPTTIIDIDQDPIPDIVQEPDPNQNNIQEPPIPEEQTLPPPEPTPLRRSARERRSALPDDYIVFLQQLTLVRWKMIQSTFAKP